MRERIKWVDTARFLGIFAIYIGHLGEGSGNTYRFVWYYHVALFFLLSGCMSTYDSEKNIIQYIKKKTKRLLLPLWGFSIFSIIIYAIQYNIGTSDVKELLWITLRGNIRNTCVIPALWFLSCLFCMDIIFKLIKQLRYKWMIFGISIIMFIIAEKLIVPRPIVEPHWIYNLDSTFYYMIYYATGYIVYPHLIKLFELNTKGKKFFFFFSGGACFAYSLYLFWGKDMLMVVDTIPGIAIFSSFLKAIILIYLNLVVAKLIENIYLLNEIGKETLFLCGNEFVVKTLVLVVCELIGLKINLQSPLHMYIYTFVLLWIAVKKIIPVEKKIISLTMKSLGIQDNNMVV